MTRLARILFWSIISAAFLGPGTVTTAASSGVEFGMDLAWALGFSTLACIVLQEAVARLVIVTGDGLGSAVRAQAGGGRAGASVAALTGTAIVLGCAAYEAGNILGGVAGLELLLPSATPATTRMLTLLTGLCAGILLWSGSARQIARILGFFVAGMGVAFVLTAVRLGPDLLELAGHLVVPRLPDGAEVLALGLVGTTVVPYNLFLGAGLAPGQRVAEMRLGLVVAIALGGLISLAVMVVGASLHGEMRYDALAAMLRTRLGPGGDALFALGLFAAGFSSAVTAPLAAGLTVRSLRARERHGNAERESSLVRLVAVGVLVVGLVVGVSGLKPIPVILLAQALNGLVLPLVAAMVLLAMNDRRRPDGGVLNGPLANALGLGCVCVTIVIGVNGFGRVFSSVTGNSPPEPRDVLRISGILVVLLVVLLARTRRRKPTA